MVQVIFVAFEYKISHFFAVIHDEIQFNRRQSLITHFLGIGQVFYLGTFFGD